MSDRRHDMDEAFEDLYASARDVRAFMGGTPRQWTLGKHRLTDEGLIEALLCLVDAVNSVQYHRNEELAEARPVPAGARETDPRPEGADKHGR